LAVRLRSGRREDAVMSIFGEKVGGKSLILLHYPIYARNEGAHQRRWKSYVGSTELGTVE
jgi:hypothetical protein